MASLFRSLNNVSFFYTSAFILVFKWPSFVLKTRQLSRASHEIQSASSLISPQISHQCMHSFSFRGYPQSSDNGLIEFYMTKLICFLVAKFVFFPHSAMIRLCVRFFRIWNFTSIYASFAISHVRRNQNWPQLRRNCKVCPIVKLKNRVLPSVSSSTALSLQTGGNQECASRCFYVSGKLKPRPIRASIGLNLVARTGKGTRKDQIRPN